MKIDEIRRLSPDELAAQLLQLKKEQFNLRFQAATGQLEKTHRVEEVRRDIIVFHDQLGRAYMKLPDYPAAEKSLRT